MHLIPRKPKSQYNIQLQCNWSRSYSRPAGREIDSSQGVLRAVTRGPRTLDCTVIRTQTTPIGSFSIIDCYATSHYTVAQYCLTEWVTGCLSSYWCLGHNNLLQTTNIQMNDRGYRTGVAPVSENFGVFQPTPLKLGICHGYQKFRRKILIGWTGQMWRLLNLSLPIRKITQAAGVYGWTQSPATHLSNWNLR
jgi:hypothetical protein